LLFTAEACKKKVPAPPPPAPPKQETPQPPPPPPAPKPQAARIVNFTGEPRSIQRGQSATLTWSVSGATAIAIDQTIGAVQANGTRQVTPGQTTTYTLTASGPGGNDTRSVTIEVTAPPAPPPPPPPPPAVSAETLLSQRVQDAYFDYDKSDVREDARRTLTSDADALKQIFQQYPNFTVVLEGNCDERGSAEYNKGLGDRRSISVKDFLVQLGIPADKMRTLSNGKEKPVCTEGTEDCYQRNRHVHFSPGN